ncbi:MAG: hypothetical protein EBR95_07550 [Verrucomicrobia bacterium]|nr:hypothetical protein [Verrucomicrobiota bacterium]
MALFRRFTALLAAYLFATTAGLAADPALTLEEVIAKARAAAATDPAALAKIRSLRLEFTSADEKGNSHGRMTLALAAPGYRHQMTVSEAPATTTVICAGRLEGWTTRQLGPLAQREVRAVTFEEFRKLQDMARDDLAFFAAPAPGQGTAEYKGLTEVAGRATHAVHYAYASGFRITRHFDAKTFALVAYDQLTPNRELLRQQIESFVEVEGIRFAAKETVTIEGRRSGEVTYGKIQVNPALTPGLFDFPSF